MQAKNLLLWEKFRPRKIEDCILLPRISNKFKDGIKSNYIFYGEPGSGKTTLSRILIGKYNKLTPFLELNSSYYGKIENLRDEIDNFCKTKPMFDVDSDIKYVLLDEFDGVSSQFQKAFKAFIEKYSENVRFIMTTNNYKDIIDEIKSRTTSINFNPTNVEEEKFVKQGIYRKIKEVILPSENRDIEKDSLVKIINKGYPDMRTIIESVQDFLIDDSDVRYINNIDNSTKEKLFKLIYDTNTTYDDTYHFVMDYFGSEKVDIMLNLLGRPFVERCLERNMSVDKLFKCNYIITDYSDKLNKSSDPIILAMTIIGKLRDILI